MVSAMIRIVANTSGSPDDATATGDGRALRSLRSREAIVGALFELIGEGILLPTAQQVAERAEVGMRTVFRHFSDMEALFVALGERLERAALPQLVSEPTNATFDERLETLVSRRVAFFEHIAPYKRAGNLKRWRSPFLTRQHQALQRQLQRDRAETLPELAAAPEDLLHAFDQASSFEAFDHYRNEQRLSRARTQAAMLRAVSSLAAEILR
jgi:AcrR family transcriptional regulator